MALSSLLGRRDRQGSSEPGVASVPRQAPRRGAASAGLLRRERRALVRAREERIRDLGGLMLEMYRRDRFREDLLAEHCAELVGLEARLQEIDSLITTGTATGAVVARCDCGAPIVSGSHFCANCGRPTGEAAVLECGNCGHPLPADAVFCASCGTPAAATMVGHGRSAARDDRGSESESPS